nr:hypothetical protein [Pandoravirus massiliensis]
MTQCGCDCPVTLFTICSHCVKKDIFLYYRVAMRPCAFRGQDHALVSMHPTKQGGKCALYTITEKKRRLRLCVSRAQKPLVKRWNVPARPVAAANRKTSDNGRLLLFSGTRQNHIGQPRPFLLAQKKKKTDAGRETSPPNLLACTAHTDIRGRLSFLKKHPLCPFPRVGIGFSLWGIVVPLRWTLHTGRPPFFLIKKHRGKQYNGPTAQAPAGGANWQGKKRGLKFNQRALFLFCLCPFIYSFVHANREPGARSDMEQREDEEKKKRVHAAVATRGFSIV